jgi:solute carrier family 8 (sodium/calcium exchanger)
MVEKLFWNPTVANLTLMALGSSAPEIILATSGVALDFEAVPSSLGPMSIVGSAAFNLLVISGVSILAVNSDIPKKILDTGVFAVTAIFSILAYIWFYLVLVIISPNRIEMWEALTTFGFMAILIVLAYGADKCRSRNVNKEE